MTSPAIPPAGLPVLTIGSHRRPEQGSCLMEYVSVLAGCRFSDRPPCTHPQLAVLAQRVNDTTSGAGRPRLALLAPALIGTGGPYRRDLRVATAVLGCCADAGLELVPTDKSLIRLQRRAERHPTTSGLGVRTFPNALRLAFNHLLRHMDRFATAERDQYLYRLLEQAIEESRRVLDLPAAGRAPQRSTLQTTLGEGSLGLGLAGDAAPG